VAFAAVDLLAGVVAAAGAGDGLSAVQRLGVDQCGGGLPVPLFDVLADLFRQVVMHAGQSAVAGPGLEVVVDEFVVREVRRQGVPLAAGAVEVADRVDDVTTRVDDRASPAGPSRDVGREYSPFGVAGVRRIVAGPGGREVIGKRGAGGSCGDPRGKIYRQGWAFGVELLV
jgi:hypothetical protein